MHSRQYALQITQWSPWIRGHQQADCGLGLGLETVTYGLGSRAKTEGYDLKPDDAHLF